MARRRERTRRTRGVNKALFDGGFRHSAIRRLLADPGFAELAEQLTDLTAERQQEAIACIPIASQAFRLSQAGQLYASLQEVSRQRREFVEEAKRAGGAGAALLPPGADTGVVLLGGKDVGKVDVGLVRSAALVLRLAGEEMGDVGPQPEGDEVQINVQQMVAILSGVST